MTKIIGLGGQKNVNFTLWDINQQYRPGDMVVYNSVIYTVTTNIPAGTPFGPEWTVAVEGGNSSFAEDAQNAVNAQSADEALALDAPDTASVKIGGGTAGQVLKSDGLGGTAWATDDAAPAGANTEVQFNDDGVFGASPSMVFIPDTATLEVTNLQVTNTVSSNLIPSSNVTYDLGSTTQRWNDLYLSNSTIYMDDQTISANAGNILFSGNIIAAELVGNATYATSAGTVERNNVTGAGNAGQIQWANIDGNLTSSNRYFIGGNGAGALNVSRDGASGTGLATYSYSNNVSVGVLFASRARGTKTAPLSAQVGDRVFSTGGQIYTGVGTATADSIPGWSPLSQTPYIAADITALPTSPSTTFGSKLSFGASNAATNSTRVMTFNDDGSLDVPGEIVAIGANLGDVSGVTIAGGTNGQVLSTDGLGNLTWATGGGGSTNPAGANTQVQFNDGGVFGADAAFTFDKATGLMSVQDLLVTGNVTGALLPDANITYDLGSATQRWKDLYLSNTTIYMGDQTISSVAGNIEFSGGVKAGLVTLPNGGIIEETSISGTVTTNTIALKPSSGTDSDQQLLVYPTAVGDFNHLHLTSGNLFNTELYLGSDDYYIKLANTGTAIINTNDNNGNSNQWTFDAVGDLTAPGTIITPANVNALNFNAALNGTLTFPQNNTRLSENIPGTELDVAVPLVNISSSGTGGTVRVYYTPGFPEYSRVYALNDGTGYVNGDQVKVQGSLLGGNDGVNDVIIELSTVDVGTVGYGDQIIISGTPIAGSSGFNIESSGDNWSFANRTFTVPGDIQNDGFTDLDIVVNDIDDDGLSLSLRYVNNNGDTTTRASLEEGDFAIEVTPFGGGIAQHTWRFVDNGDFQMTNDTGNIVAYEYPLSLISRENNNSPFGHSVALDSQWNIATGGGTLSWTTVAAGFRGATITTNLGGASYHQGADDIAKVWTFTDNGTLELPTLNNEIVTLAGSRVTVGQSSPPAAPVGTPTTVYTPTSGVYAYKAIVTIKHDMGGTIEIETFEVMASTGASDTVFTVSNRLNTYSAGSVADVTIGASFELIIDAKYGTTNTVTFAVTEFK
jgi:hypothetical protein